MSTSEAYAENFGDITVHEVAPRDSRLMYVSHYAVRMRVLSYDSSGLEQVRAFVEARGSNYRGVEVHRLANQEHIPGSDRDRGIRIFT